MEQKTFNLTNPVEALAFLAQLAENSPATGTTGQAYLQMIQIKNSFELIKGIIERKNSLVDPIPAEIWIGESLVGEYDSLCEAIEASKGLPVPSVGDYEIFELSGSGPQYPAWTGPRPRTKPTP